MNKKLNLMYILALIGAVVTSFTLIKFYEIEANNLHYSVHDVMTTLMPYKIVILGIAFVLIAMVFTIYKINRNFQNFKNDNLEKCDLVEINEKLVCLSKVDMLTMLANEVYFDELYEREFLRSIREKTSLCMILINVDDFKSYNDIYGKERSDSILVEISNIIKENLKRPCDFLARLKSDNFVVLLPNTTDGNCVATRCLEAVENLQIEHENSIASNVLTVTAGISSINPTQNDEKDILLSKSKQGLLKAKELGRNRIVKIN